MLCTHAHHFEKGFGSVLTVWWWCPPGQTLTVINTNSNMSSKRAVVSSAPPLKDPSILLHILSILGPGQHLFISAVSRAWRESYERVGSVQMAGINHQYTNQAVLHTITSKTTLCSAIFGSPAAVRLAHDCGLAFDNWKLQRMAGRAAGILTLQAAQEVGLELTDTVLIGAAEAASVAMLQLLHTQQGCKLPEDICAWAARSGSVDTLRWLKEHGEVFESSTCEGAAAGAHLRVLQFLRHEGCEWDEWTCSAAARNGNFTTLKWLHEQGCPWELDEICGDAAEAGSMEMLVYLKQQGCVYNAITIRDAAMTGQLVLCHYLIAEQCPFDQEACAEAAAGGHLETLRFLHESGCPWDIDRICVRAAKSGSVELLQYLRQHGCNLHANAMRFAAMEGHTQVCQYLHAEQCPWSALAYGDAAYGGHVDTLRWLIEHGAPYDTQRVRVSAVISGHFPTIMYMLGLEPPASAAQLTELLSAAGVHNQLLVAKWLRQQGARWPTVVRHYDGRPWSTDVLAWARDEGCTSPTD
jgi:hypothetical protein